MRSANYATCVVTSDSATPVCGVCGGGLKGGATKYCSLACYHAVQRSGSVADRFWAKAAVGADDACWPWTASIAKTTGYGQFTWAGKYGRTAPAKAHRVAWELTHGDIPAGLSVLHHCDNRPCVNPRHLFVGTHTDNMQDAAAKGRLHTARPRLQKVTVDQIAEIRSLIAGGALRYRVAEQFGISKTQVTFLVTGQRRQYDAPLEGS